MERRSFLAFGFAWLPFGHKQEAVLCGIPFHVKRYRSSNRRYLLIHGNEQTARDLLNVHMRTHPGVAHLVTGLNRNVPMMGGSLDPNRMFSRAGAEANLRKLNPAWTQAQMEPVLAFLDAHRAEILKRVTPPPGGVLIALHNNSEGYNVNEELADSDRTSIKQPDHAHEFFLCTDERDFDIIASSPYNVVLQKAKPAVDDGSLSRLAAAQGFRYINLETKLGEFEWQLERLSWLERHLRVS